MAAARAGMMLRRLVIDPGNPDPDSVALAVAVLRSGGLVVLPTETVYGLAADVFNVAAVRRVFAVKERPWNLALPVQVHDPRLMSTVTPDTSRHLQNLTERFMPGPLTVVVRRADGLPALVTAGGTGVAVRIPDCAVTQAVLRRFNGPLIMTSANIHGRPAPVDAQDAMAQIGEKVDIVLDGGRCRIGQESTVIDLTAMPPRLLRPGAVTREELEAVLGPIAGPD